MPMEQGRITCLTCHDGQAAQGHEQRASRGNPLLRGGEDGPAFCARCHVQTQPPGHKTDYPWAHPTAQRRVSGKVDQESAACMTCHDGTIASDAGSHSQPPGLAQSPDHAVGTLFAAKPGGELVLVPTSRLDRRVRLMDGKLGCGSCHNVYTRQPNILVMNNRGSQLCLTCHVE
jgi:predicted CXXCH cytochrome family protein